MLIDVFLFLNYNDSRIMELLAKYSHLPFYVLATITVVCSLGMIFLPNLIRAGFLLIGAFCAIAGLYFVLAANFVAISQVLIYAVGIVLVIIFAVMLCNLKEQAADVVKEEVIDPLDIGLRKLSALVVCSALFALLVYVINSQDWASIAQLSGAEAHFNIISEVSNQYTARIGQLMLTRYVLPFELISILLLVVLVGVVILSKKHLDTEVKQGT